MNLKEYIESHQGDTVKIGAGSGFIYCDTITEDTVDKIDQMSQDKYSKLIEKQKECESKSKELKSIMNDIIPFIKGLSEIYPLNKRYFIEITAINQKFKGITEKKLKSISKKVKEFKPYLEREVKDEYKSIMEDALICIVTGSDNGNYWTCEEYRKGIVTEEGEEECSEG